MFKVSSSGLTLRAGGDNGLTIRSSIMRTRQPRLGRFALITVKRLDGIDQQLVPRWRYLTVPPVQLGTVLRMRLGNGQNRFGLFRPFHLARIERHPAFEGSGKGPSR